MRVSEALTSETGPVRRGRGRPKGSGKYTTTIVIRLGPEHRAAIEFLKVHWGLKSAAAVIRRALREAAARVESSRAPLGLDGLFETVELT